MNTELVPANELVPALFREGRRFGVTLSVMFAVIAITALILGIVLPRSYVTTTTILAQSSDIIQPLLEGRAVATGVIDHAGMARQIVYGRKVMQEVLKLGGWESSSPVEQDRLAEQIKARTTITSPRPDLVQIAYRDSDAHRSFVMARGMADLLIQESRAAKARESREAFEFIDAQVTDYHRKLTDAEASLLAYRSANADAQPGSAADSSARISSLRSQVEQTRMALMEQQSRASAVSSQLGGESAITAVQTRANLYQAQLVDLQSQLDRLLLTYTENYPDVVRTRHQIQDIQRQLADESKRRSEQPEHTQTAFDGAQFNPAYQELKSRLGEANREVAGTRSRMAASESMLASELERSKRIAASEGALAELTRDYDVNREIYQDMLRRRENARVSMVMDEEQRGLTLRIQDPAVLPLRPSGLRLMHFSLAGLTLALAIPLGLLFTLVRFDPRIRSARQLERQTGYPVLASVPLYMTQRERVRQRTRISLAGLLVIAVLLAYALTYWIRLHGS